MGVSDSESDVRFGVSPTSKTAGAGDGEQHTKKAERNTHEIFCAIFVILRGTRRKNIAIFFGF